MFTADHVNSITTNMYHTKYLYNDNVQIEFCADSYVYLHGRWTRWHGVRNTCEYANPNYRRWCNLNFKNRNVDGWPPRGSYMCCPTCVTRWRWLTNYFRAFRTSLQVPTYVRDREEVKMLAYYRMHHDFTNRFMLTRLDTVFESIIPLRHILWYGQDNYSLNDAKFLIKNRV